MAIPTRFLFATGLPSVLLALLCLAATGCRPESGKAAEQAASGSGASAAKDGGDEDKATQDRKDDAVLVKIAPLERGSISSFIEISSDIESLHSVDVYSELDGLRVIEIAVEEGDRVDAGNVLARLDDEEILLELRQAEVEFAEAQKQKDKAAIAVNEAAERCKAAEIQQKKYYEDYQATLEIAKDGLVSDKDLSSDRLAWEQASSDQELRKLEKETAALEAELAVTAADKAAIARDNASLRVRRTTIRAPIGGTVAERAVDLGMMVSGAAKLFTIVDTRKLIANIYLPQEDIKRIREGMPVLFACDAYPDHEFRGEVDLISPVVDPANGTVKVRVRIPPDEKGLLRPGMFIGTKVLVSSNDNALLVSRKAVFYEDEMPCFFIVRDGKARKVIFDRGAATDEVLEIVAARDATGGELDLAEDMEIVIVGQDKLKEDDAIKVSEEHP
jgi:RND family efflux transporter MFP subunit